MALKCERVSRGGRRKGKRTIWNPEGKNIYRINGPYSIHLYVLSLNIFFPFSSEFQPSEKYSREIDGGKEVGRQQSFAPISDRFVIRIEYEKWRGK